MKKSLLFGTMLLAGVTSAMAVTDGVTYESHDGISCVNKWIDSRVDNIYGWNKLPFAELYAKARTACIATINGEEKIAVGFSKTITVDEKSNDYAHLVIINFFTGEAEKTLQLTCDGEAITGLLCANQVGCDEAGNVWIAGYVATTFGESGASPLKIYKVDNFETGACTLAASLELPAEEADKTGRIDYCNIAGDITRATMPCVVMSSLNADGTHVYGWRAEQGSDEWAGLFDDYVCNTIVDTYPEGQTMWGTAPTVTIVKDEEVSGSLFYVDGFTTCPTLYNTEGTIVESFASATDLAPKVGTNGVGEFSLGDVNFVVYSIGQYDVDPGCQIRVARLGDGMSFEGMQSYWDLPQGGLGQVSDGGTRYHAVDTKIYTDANGKQGAYLLTYKCNNGLGVYAVAEEGWQDPNAAGVNDAVVDQNNNARVEYFNLNGQAVKANNLTPGFYITRQGNKVEKVIVK